MTNYARVCTCSGTGGCTCAPNTTTVTYPVIYYPDNQVLDRLALIEKMLEEVIKRLDGRL